MKGLIAMGVMIILVFGPGFVQWFVLRRIVRRAYLWVLFQGVFWLSLWFWLDFYDLVYPPKTPSSGEGAPLLLWSAFLLIHFLAGLVMAYLLRHPKPQRTALEAA